MDEKELQELKDQLSNLGGSIDKKLKENAESYKNAAQEVKDGVKKEIEPMLKQYNDLADKVKTIQDQIDQVDTKLNRVNLTAGPAQKACFNTMVLKKLQETSKDNKGKGLRGLISKSRPYEIEMDFKTDDMTQGNSFESTTVVPYDYQPGIVYDPLNPYRVRDLITPGTTQSNVVSFIQEYAYSEAADMTAEGAEYKQEDFDLKMLSENVRKLTSYIIVSEEMLEDVVGLMSYINARLPEKLKVKEDQQLLYGTGQGYELTGLTVDAADYSDNLADKDISRIDVLVDACRQVRVNEYRATAILIHPTDATLIKLTKDDNGNYIHPWIFMPNGQITLDGIPVIVSTAITSGDFLVGDFKLGAQVFDRRQLSLELSYENEDNFVKGMVTVRLSERLTLCIYRPNAFVYGSFAVALAEGTA
jgi:HK97 family phage major capsid protein